MLERKSEPISNCLESTNARSLSFVQDTWGLYVSYLSHRDLLRNVEVHTHLQARQVES